MKGDRTGAGRARRRRDVGPAVGAAILLCVAAPARADDTHYQNQLIGERALGMGGAFTAVATDPTAAFYNPGGLVMTPSSSISASLNLYGVEHRIIEDGFVSYVSGERATADLETTSFPTIPTTFGVLRGFGERFPDGSRRHAVAFSMLIPDQSSVSYDATIGRSGESELDVFRLSENDRTLWAGPSYAVRLGDNLAIGLTAFAAIRTYSRSYYRALEFPDGLELPWPTADYFESDRVDTTLDSVELILRLGALYRPLPHLRIGLTLGFPSIHLWGDGSVANQFAYARLDDPEPYGDFRLESAGDLPVESFTPLEIRTGLAWRPLPDLLVALDVTYVLPTFQPYDRVHLWGEDVESGRVRYDDLFASTVQRRGVLNLNGGVEWIIGDSWPMRAGAFTNFSSAPPVRTDRASLERIDVLGGTISVGYRFAGFTLNFGFLGSVGWGSAQAYSIAGDGPAYLRRDARYDLFYFFLSGAQQIVSQTLEGWIEAPAGGE